MLCSLEATHWFGNMIPQPVAEDEIDVIYTYVHLFVMAHKTLTISEEAYNALSRAKTKDESFTKVILRLTRARVKGNLLEYIQSFAPDIELANKIEKVLQKRNRIRLGNRRSS